MRKVTNPEEFRKEVRCGIETILITKKYSENIEKGIYNISIRIADSKNVVKKWENIYFVQIYIDRLRSVYMNLKDPIINEKLEKGIFKPHELGTMTHQEMSPEKWKKLIYEKKEKDENKYAPNLDGNTDMFVCRKCKSNKCSYYQLQTRSGDEPMTTYVTCVSCANRWKC
jgi:transcription elongation factor S-II